MKARFRRMATVLGAVMALAALTVMPALADTSSGAAAVSSALSDAASEATTIVSAGIPVVLGVGVVWVALRFGKRILRSIG